MAYEFKIISEIDRNGVFPSGSLIKLTPIGERNGDNYTKNEHYRVSDATSVFKGKTNTIEITLTVRTMGLNGNVLRNNQGEESLKKLILTTVCDDELVYCPGVFWVEEVVGLTPNPVLMFVKIALRDKPTVAS